MRPRSWPKHREDCFNDALLHALHAVPKRQPDQALCRRMGVRQVAMGAPVATTSWRVVERDEVKVGLNAGCAHCGNEAISRCLIVEQDIVEVRVVPHVVGNDRPSCDAGGF